MDNDNADHKKSVKKQKIKKIAAKNNEKKCVRQMFVFRCCIPYTTTSLSCAVHPALSLLLCATTLSALLFLCLGHFCPAAQKVPPLGLIQTRKGLPSSTSTRLFHVSCFILHFSFPPWFSCVLATVLVCVLHLYSFFPNKSIVRLQVGTLPCACFQCEIKKD